jgi:hypothetical protein
VAPIPPERPALDAYIKHGWLALPSEQRDHPDWAANNLLSRPLFQQEQQDAIDEFDKNIYHCFFFQNGETIIIVNSSLRYIWKSDMLGKGVAKIPILIPDADLQNKHSHDQQKSLS